MSYIIAPSGQIFSFYEYADFIERVRHDRIAARYPYPITVSYHSLEREEMRIPITALVPHNPKKEQLNV